MKTAVAKQKATKKQVKKVGGKNIKAKKSGSRSDSEYVSSDSELEQQHELQEEERKRARRDLERRKQNDARLVKSQVGDKPLGKHGGGCETCLWRFLSAGASSVLLWWLCRSSSAYATSS